MSTASLLSKQAWSPMSSLSGEASVAPIVAVICLTFGTTSLETSDLDVVVEISVNLRIRDSCVQHLAGISALNEFGQISSVSLLAHFYCKLKWFLMYRTDSRFHKYRSGSRLCI